MYHPLLGFCSVFDTELVLNPEEVVTSVVAEASPNHGFFTDLAYIPPTVDELSPHDRFGKREAPLPNTNSSAEASSEDQLQGDYDYYEHAQDSPAVSDGVASPLAQLRPDLFNNSISVTVFLPGQFYMTGAGVGVDQGKVEEVYLHQDVTDKVVY